MPSNVETMFYVRQAPWHGLGVRVEEALKKSGLNWEVIQKSIFTSDNTIIPSYKANIRSKDGHALSIVTDRYNIVQNEEAFAFIDKENINLRIALVL